MNRCFAIFFVAVLVAFSSCGTGVPADLPGSYGGLATYTWENASFTTTLTVSADIVDTGDGEVLIIASGRDPRWSGAPLVTCRLTGRPTSTGFEVEPGSSCQLEGRFNPCGLSKVPYTATIISTNAVKSSSGLTVNVRARGSTGCEGFDEDRIDIRASLMKSF
jgi:hypothetical protein